MADQDFPLLRAFIEVDAKKAKREIASLRSAVKALKRDIENLPKRISLDTRFAKPFADADKSVSSLNRGLRETAREAERVSRALVPLGRFQVAAGPPGGRALVPVGGFPIPPRGTGFPFPFAQNRLGGPSAARAASAPQVLISGPSPRFELPRSFRIPPISFSRINQGGAGGGGRGGRQNFRGITLPAIFGTFAVASFTQDSLKLATAIEKTTFALGKLTDSEPELQNLFKNLRKLAFETTTDFTELLPSAQKLLGSGFGAGEVEPLLRQLADLSIITSANGVSFGRLVDVVARNNLQFRLLTRDVREFTNAGLNILPSLQRQLGAANFEEVFDAIRKGEVNINNLRQAITDLTSEGGIAFRLQADAANTAFLAFDKLREEVNRTKQAFGDFIIKDLGIKSVAEVATDALRVLRGEVINLGATGEAETPGQRALRQQAQGRNAGDFSRAFGPLLTRARLFFLRADERGIEAALNNPLRQRVEIGQPGDARQRAIRLQLARDLRRRASFADTDVERRNLIAQAEGLEDDLRIVRERLAAALAEVRAEIERVDPVGAAEARRERERAARNERRERLNELSREIEILDARASRFRSQGAAARLRGDDVSLQALDLAFQQASEGLQTRRAEFARLGGVVDPITRRFQAAQANELKQEIIELREELNFLQNLNRPLDLFERTRVEFLELEIDRLTGKLFETDEALRKFGDTAKSTFLALIDPVLQLGAVIRAELTDPLLGAAKAPIFEFLSRGRFRDPSLTGVIQPRDILEGGRERRLRFEREEGNAQVRNELAVQAIGNAIGRAQGFVFQGITTALANGASDLVKSSASLDKAATKLENADTVNVRVGDQSGSQPLNQ